MGDIYRESKSSFERSNPFQVGAEYFGNITDKVDINLLKMCHEIITLSKTKRIVIELNDSFFINTYINKLSIDDTTRKQLNHLISLKSMDEITQYYKSKKLSKSNCFNKDSAQSIYCPLDATANCVPSQCSGEDFILSINLLAPENNSTSRPATGCIFCRCNRRN